LKKISLILFAVTAVLAFRLVPVHGHFQLLYTIDPALNAGRATNLLLLFTHPSHGGPHMAMGKPEAFYVVSQRGDADAVKTDLTQHLRQVMWNGEQGETPAYEAALPAAVTRSLGDYVFVLQPSPYYEKGEDKYIQQFTKMIMNVGGVPGNWAGPVGLPTEILPLNKPYANWTGGVFRGVVLSEGKPVPDAELEVEYINYAADLSTRRFAPKPYVVLPQASYGTMSIRANDRGEFTVGLPRAGWWGICALDVGPVNEHQGKPLSQDAVIWVHVRDMQ
jgi:cobalt/nickel transport protein